MTSSLAPTPFADYPAAGLHPSLPCNLEVHNNSGFVYYRIDGFFKCSAKDLFWPPLAPFIFKIKLAEVE